MSRRLAAVLSSAALVTLSYAQPSLADAVPVPAPAAGPAPSAAAASVPGLVPVPVSVRATGGSYEITSRTRIVARSPEAMRAASALAEVLRRSTGYPLPITHDGGGIVLDANGGVGQGAEGYRLTVARDGVRIAADTGEGLFRGVQTFRQLLPAKVESQTAQSGPWQVSGVAIEDHPRFAYRGAMLDVSRHFFSVSQVEKYIDLAAAYKINTFHLHLSDDQGWRIAIKSWPRLAKVGGRTAVDGDPGGYYSQADYKAIVKYAEQRYVTVIPEIDTPGHTNAALASYAELNCDGKAPDPYTGTDVGFSSLCTSKEITYRFLDDVVRELARLTPGPYINIGGDEAHSTAHEDYVAFVGRLQKIVHKYGKSMMGWEEIAGADIRSDSVGEHWNPVTGTQEGTEVAREAVKRGVKLVMAPADHAYLDMKYDANTPYGQDWAGLVSARASYDWDPAQLITGVGEGDILGVEAPIWTETLRTPSDLQFMAYPRLPGIAEIGWSPAAGHSWDAYRTRIAAQGARWTAAGVNFYKSPEIPF